MTWWLHTKSLRLPGSMVDKSPGCSPDAETVDHEVTLPASKRQEVAIPADFPETAHDELSDVETVPLRLLSLLKRRKQRSKRQVSVFWLIVTCVWSINILLVWYVSVTMSRCSRLVSCNMNVSSGISSHTECNGWFTKIYTWWQHERTTNKAKGFVLTCLRGDSCSNCTFL